MPMADDLIDQLLEGSTSREDILGEEGLLKQLSGQVAERILDAESWRFILVTPSMILAVKIPATPVTAKAARRCAVLTVP